MNLISGVAFRCSAGRCLKRERTFLEDKKERQVIKEKGRS